MAGTSKKRLRNDTTPAIPLSQSLESTLASVMEQADVLLNTPQGVRRRKKNVAPPTKLRPSPPIAVDACDRVEALDQEVVRVHVGKGGGIPQEVCIRFREHERSPYVLSLQQVILSASHAHHPETAERFHGAMLSAPLRVDAHPIDAYAPAHVDLRTEYDPYVGSDQFTPAEFEQSYRAVYGRLDRISRMMREAVLFARSAFERVEHIEERAVEEVQEALVEAPRFSLARAVIAFVGLAVVVTLPANAISLYRSVAAQKHAISDASEEALRSLFAAKDAQSIPDSADALRRASARFRSIDAMLGDTNALAVSVASFLPKKYRDARALIEVGEKSSEAARVLALGFDALFTNQGQRLHERFTMFGTYARVSLTLLSDASRAAARVDLASVPFAQRADVSSMLTRLDDGMNAVRESAALSDMLARMVGKDSLRKYVVIFQNPSELRPTGGFMGSFAEVTLDRGVVRSVRIPSGGTYDLKAQLLARVVPPQPLQLIASRWQLQDANWFPDFPTTAKKIRWFWSKSGQPTIDGVIAVNASLIERLLDITGPIDMPEYGKTIDTSNFMLETQKAVELEYDTIANTPKKFIGDLSVKLIERMKTLQKKDWLKIAALISHALETKEVQVALTNADEEALAERYGWSGMLKGGSGDRLALIEANIAGQKTDGVISEAVRHHVDIQNDGSIVDTVQLTRTHGGRKGELFRGVRNVSYLRAFVPKGSRLLSASGFRPPPPSLFKQPEEATTPDVDIHAIESTARTTSNGIRFEDEGSYTSFGGWMQLDPGETQQITLSYKLPFTVADMLPQTETSPDRSAAGATRAYLLLLASQSGKSNRTLTTTISYPSSWRVAWSRPTELQLEGTVARYTGTWDRDRALALSFTPAHAKMESSQGAPTR